MNANCAAIKISSPEKSMVKMLSNYLSGRALVVILIGILWHAEVFAASESPCPRIVSQAPYISETLTWLGKASCIVGISDFEQGKDLPRTGGLINPDFDAIARLKPDLIFLPEWNPPEIAGPYDDDWNDPKFKDVKIIRLFGFQSVDQIFNNVQIIASSLKMASPETYAERLRQSFEKKFSSLKAQNLQLGNVAVLTDCLDAPAIIGSKTFINDALTRSGFSVIGPSASASVFYENIVAQLESYWIKSDIGAVIVLTDILGPNCIRSAQRKLIPMYPVGVERLSSPSPALIDDLDHVFKAISELSEKGRGRRDKAKNASISR